MSVWDDAEQELAESKPGNVWDVAEQELSAGEPSLWGDFLKPTLKAIPKEGAGLVAGAAAFPVAGLAGIVSVLEQTGKGVGNYFGMTDAEPDWTQPEKIIQGVASAPEMFLDTPEERQGLANIMKPVELVQRGAEYAGDMAEDFSPVLAATIKTGIEVAVFLGLPVLAKRLHANAKAGKIEAAKNVLMEIENAQLEALKAEPNRLAGLKAIEDKLAKQNLTPVSKSAKSSAQAFEQEFAQNPELANRQIVPERIQSDIQPGWENQSPAGRVGLAKDLAMAEDASKPFIAKPAAESANVFSEADAANRSPLAADAIRKRLAEEQAIFGEEPKQPALRSIKKKSAEESAAIFDQALSEMESANKSPIGRDALKKSLIEKEQQYLKTPEYREKQFIESEIDNLSTEFVNSEGPKVVRIDDGTTQQIGSESNPLIQRINERLGKEGLQELDRLGKLKGEKKYDPLTKLDTRERNNPNTITMFEKYKKGEILTDKQARTMEIVNDEILKEKSKTVDRTGQDYADWMEDEGFTPYGGQRTVAAELKPGDEFIGKVGDKSAKIDRYKVEETPDGDLLFKDGETIKGDVFTKLYVDGIKEGKAQTTADPVKPTPKAKTSNENFDSFTGEFEAKGWSGVEGGEPGALKYGTESPYTIVSPDGKVQVGVSVTPIVKGKRGDIIRGSDKVKNGITLESLNVDPSVRGSGRGSDTIKSILETADKHGLEIRGQVGTMQGFTPGLSKPELFKWYERNGFKREAGSDIVVREARAKKINTEPSSTGTPIKTGTSNTLYSGIPVDAAIKLQERIGTKVWDEWVMKKIPDFLEKKPVVGKVVKAARTALDTEYRGNMKDTPKYLELAEQKKKSIVRGHEYGVDVGKRLQALPEQAQMQVGEFLRGERQNVNHTFEPIAKEAQKALKDLGKQSVELGLLDEKTYFKSIGKYFPRLYDSKEYAGLLERFGEKKPDRIDLNRFKARKDIPKDVRKQMGEILTPGYPVAKGIIQLTNAVETAKFFKGIASNPDWAIAKTPRMGKNGKPLVYKIDGQMKPIKEFPKNMKVPDGWKKLNADKRLGDLSEAYVHPEIYQEINQAVRMPTNWEKNMGKALGIWKYGKVVLSPKTHVRNNMSNSILAHLGGMPMYEQPVYFVKALKAMRDKNSPFYRAAKAEGVLGSTFVDAELKGIFNSIEREIGGTAAGSWTDRLGKFANVAEKAGATGKKLGDFYQAQEQVWKIAKMIHSVERRGLTMPEAARDAQKWLFDYSKLTRFQEAYRGTGKGKFTGTLGRIAGAPFATFTFKAIPRVFEATVKYPHRLILPAAIVYGIQEAARRKFGDTPEQEEAKRELLPDWMKGTFFGIPNFARMPLENQYGDEEYLNLSYIFPWGDLSGGDGFGLSGLSPASMPITKEFIEQAWNKDRFTGDAVVKSENMSGLPKAEQILEEAKMRGGHAYRTFAPTIAADIPKIYNAVKGEPDYKGRMRDVRDVVLDSTIGLKMYAVNYADMLSRKINNSDPKNGIEARKILSDIRELSVKRNALRNNKKPYDHIDKQIGGKIRQLKGLAEETKKISETYRKTKGR